jgi:hypothetical protein
MSEAPLLQAALGPEDRAELLRDLTALAEIDSAQVHDAGGTRLCRLDEAFAALEEGTAERALLRYRFDGQAWLDTLIAGADGIRLVRIAEADAAGG